MRRKRKDANMLVEFILIMEDLIVDDQRIDEVSFRWQTDISHAEILELSHEWITSHNFLTHRMIGLQRVGESSLTIEPMEDIPDFHIPL